MNAWSVAILSYALAFVFGLFVAGVITGLARLMDRMGLGSRGGNLDLSIPSAESLADEEAIAAAIAAAHSRQK